MNNEIKQCYQILEVSLGASFQEIKKAYRELCFVWHPDRFSEEQTDLKNKAHEKLQKINNAYQLLKEYHQKNPNGYTPVDKTNTSDAQENNNNSEQYYVISTTGINYTKLRFLLELQQWKEADDETLNLMIKLKSIYKTSQLPCEDLWIMDKLWQDYSSNQFGFLVQRELLKNAGHFDVLCWVPILISDKYLNFDGNIYGHLPAKYITCFYGSRRKYLILQKIFGVSNKEFEVSLFLLALVVPALLVIFFVTTIVIPIKIFGFPERGVYSNIYISYAKSYVESAPNILRVAGFFWFIFYLVMIYYKQIINELLAKEFSKFFDRIKKCNL